MGQTDPLFLKTSFLEKFPTNWDNIPEHSLCSGTSATPGAFCILLRQTSKQTNKQIDLPVCQLNVSIFGFNFYSSHDTGYSSCHFGCSLLLHHWCCDLEPEVRKCKVTEVGAMKYIQY